MVGPSDCNEGLSVNFKVNLSLTGALASGRVLVVVLGEHMKNRFPQSAMNRHHSGQLQKICTLSLKFSFWERIYCIY